MFSVCNTYTSYHVNCVLCYILPLHISVSVLARSTFPVQFRFRFRSQVYLFTLHSFQDLFGVPPSLSAGGLSQFGRFLCNKLQDLFSSGSRQKDQKMFAYFNSIICSDNSSDAVENEDFVSTQNSKFQQTLRDLHLSVCTVQCSKKIFTYIVPNISLYIYSIQF